MVRKELADPEIHVNFISNELSYNYSITGNSGNLLKS